MTCIVALSPKDLFFFVFFLLSIISPEKINFHLLYRIIEPTERFEEYEI